MSFVVASCSSWLSQITPIFSACKSPLFNISSSQLICLIRLTRMRQMACHPDLVLKSKTNAAAFPDAQVGEATVCRICNDIAEDAIQSKCRHIFDRECIKQY